MGLNPSSSSIVTWLEEKEEGEKRFPTVVVFAGVGSGPQLISLPAEEAWEVLLVYLVPRVSSIIKQSSSPFYFACTFFFSIGIEALFNLSHDCTVCPPPLMLAWTFSSLSSFYHYSTED